MHYPSPVFRRLLSLLVALTLLTGLLPAVSAAEAVKKAFDLPADEAERALKRLAVQSGHEVLFASEATAGVRTHAVFGSFTALDAARQLLAGTRLAVAQNSETGALVVSVAPPGTASSAPPSAAAASTASGAGTIRGRVFIPATGEYLRNAEISIRGTSLTAVSEDDGSYVLTRVPAGETTLVASFTGYTPGVATVSVGAGQTVVRDLELVSTLAGTTGAKDSVIKLTAFTVSSERDGNAKAIMDQRNSMNITNTVSSDVFGDNAEGNVGDFLRNMPGIDLELTQGEVRNVRLRGLGSEYNSVTIDGVSLASADANTGAAGNARAFSFEQVSLSSMDSIEVSKTISADVDANAPAGTINLKSKRAFSRAGRRIVAQANLMAYADEWHFRKTYGPDDAKHRKLLPGGMIEYSDVFFDKRLGVVLNVAESNLYSENARSIVTYNYAKTPADQRPVVPTTVAFLHAPRLNRRSTVTLTTDVKATQNLVLSLSLIYNYASLYNPQRTVTFTAGGRTAVVGTDPLRSFTSAATGSVSSNPNVVVKPGETYTAVPRFEYKLGELTVEGRFAGSDSKSWYNPLARKGSTNNAGTPALAGIQFRAERSSLISSDWRITQIAGPDFAVGNSYTSPVFTSNDGRYGRTQVYSGDITATYRTRQILPIIWKAGVKRKHEVRDFIVDTESKRYSYTGPGAGVGALAGLQSAYGYDVDVLHANIASISGRNVFVADALALGKLFRERPELFTQSLTRDNYYNAFIGNDRHYEEDITAGFAMATASVGRAILRAGLRFEETKMDALEYNPRSPAELAAAGFAETGGRATTIPGLQYQYFSQPKIHREGSYDNLFPSASIKYKFARNLDAHFGYSTTIRRPTIRDLAGVWTINDDAFTVNAPNPRLKPETSDNLAARLAYYFEPVGILGFNLFQNTVEGLHRETRISAAEYGYDGNLDLANYDFITTVASVDKVVIRGMELEYSQSLSFLPRPFKGLNLRASYTRSYADVVTPQMSPHAFNTGFNYTLGRFNVYTSFNWRDDTPTNIANTLYNRHRATIDVGGSVRLTNRFSVFYTGRNIRSEPVITMQQMPDAPAVAQTYERTGTIWTFGIKGVW
ncbi:MAG: TonB-dependent receptor [Verrucomicrobiota bacterium]